MELPVLSGYGVIKLLAKVGFSVLDQTGSHVILIKTVGGRKLKPVVPLHKELKTGTLLSIIKQAGMTREEFISIYESK